MVSTLRVPEPFGDLDVHLMREGKHARLDHKLGSHPSVIDGMPGTRFAVWAPNATSVSVIGDFNGWEVGRHELRPMPGATTIWEGFVPHVGHGAMYKYQIEANAGAYRVAKADPFARRHQDAPGTASIVWQRDYDWGDGAWMAARGECARRAAPISIYEVHLGSWKRRIGEDNRHLSYREMADELVGYVQKLGFTHVELLPLSEHPFFGSWGYETTGYFAAAARYGEPEELMALVDALHRGGIGVIFDWVPAHFPSDEHGLVYFDGTALFEYGDPRRGIHPEWSTRIFDYGREEVRSFLLSSALSWIERFHADGLRVDGVSTMLYRDYGRGGDDWVRNERGSNENFEAVELLRRLNEAIRREQPEAMTIAEESTAWPKVTGEVSEPGCLGFDFKWDLGWMHDTLAYFAEDPIQRVHHHGKLTMRGLYFDTEAFVVPLSHDEVVHGKRSLLEKMPGDAWQKLANLRLLFAYQFTQPGKKLLFMGAELAQKREWSHDGALDWHLLEEVAHQRIQLMVGELNRIYRSVPALHELDCERRGFEWVVVDDAARCILAYERVARNGDRVLVVFNFTPHARENYRIGVLQDGDWEEILNTDASSLGGTGRGNFGAVQASPVPSHGRLLSLNLTLPPLAAVLLRPRRVKGAPQ